MNNNKFTEKEQDLFKRLKKFKSDYKTIFNWVCFIVLLLIFIIPLAIFIAYWIGDNGHIFIYTSLTVGDALGFYASLISALSAIFLGVVAIYQSNKANKIANQAVSIERNALLSILTPSNSISLKFYDEHILEKTIYKCTNNKIFYGAELNITLKNTSNLLITDCNVTDIKIVCLSNNIPIISSTNNESSLLLSSGFKFGFNKKIVSSNEDTELSIIIPEINISKNALQNQLSLYISYLLNCTNIYGNSTVLKSTIDIELYKNDNIYIGTSQNIVKTEFKIEDFK